MSFLDPLDKLKRTADELLHIQIPCPRALTIGDGFHAISYELSFPVLCPLKFSTSLLWDVVRWNEVCGVIGSFAIAGSVSLKSPEACKWSAEIESKQTTPTCHNISNKETCVYLDLSPWRRKV